jgi:hypothetical protein
MRAWLSTLQEAGYCSELQHGLMSAAMQLAHLKTMSFPESLAEKAEVRQTRMTIPLLRPCGWLAARNVLAASPPCNLLRSVD